MNLQGPESGTALQGWAGNSSTCTWTATNSVGVPASYTETMTTKAAAPEITLVKRVPSTMTAGQPFTLQWTSANATSVRRVCTATRTGFVVDEQLGANGNVSGTASADWVGNDSTCNWIAQNASGNSAGFVEVMRTSAALDPNVTYIHTDGLGSPVARTDSLGNVLSVTRYEPYGLTAAGEEPTIGFTGHVRDFETGLTYMQQRYYDPVAGRFLSIDPVVTDANTGSSFNRYNYANNNPYKYVDPDGRQSVGSMPTTSREGYLQMGVSVWLGSILKTTQPIAAVAITPLAPEAVVAKEAIVVTQASIQAALKGSPMTTAQSAVSLPAVANYVQKIEAGMVAPAIKVDGKIIVEGNHRYVAGRLAGKEPAQTAGTASPSQVRQAKPIENIKVDPTDWGNR